MLHLASTSASIALLDLSLSRPIPSAVPTVYTHANLDTTLFNLWRIHPFYTNNYIMAACERGECLHSRTLAEEAQVLAGWGRLRSSLCTLTLVKSCAVQ